MTNEVFAATFKLKIGKLLDSWRNGDFQSLEHFAEKVSKVHAFESKMEISEVDGEIVAIESDIDDELENWCDFDDAILMKFPR